jgi:CheY-like chemotaxis protein
MQCIEAGMDDYLAKPIDEDRLEGVLRLVAAARPAKACGQVTGSLRKEHV